MPGLQGCDLSWTSVPTGIATARGPFSRDRRVVQQSGMLCPEAARRRIRGSAREEEKSPVAGPTKAPAPPPIGTLLPALPCLQGLQRAPLCSLPSVALPPASSQLSVLGFAAPTRPSSGCEVRTLRPRAGSLSPFLPHPSLHLSFLLPSLPQPFFPSLLFFLHPTSLRQDLGGLASANT